MAVSKKSRARGQADEMPDAAAFVRVLDDGLATAADVSAAYRAALTEWRRDKTSTALLQSAMRDGGVAEPRPLTEPNGPGTPEGRLIALHRTEMFSNHVDHQEDQ